MDGCPVTRTKGGLRKTIGKTVKKDLDSNGLPSHGLWLNTIPALDPCSRPHLVGQGMFVIFIGEKDYKVGSEKAVVMLSLKELGDC